MSIPSRFILWFEQISIDDVPLVGGKNASLEEMIREPTPQGVKVPDGFAITAGAYRHFLETSGIDRRIRRRLGKECID
jgi:pyruvate,water dikinase